LCLLPENLPSFNDRLDEANRDRRVTIEDYPHGEGFQEHQQRRIMTDKTAIEIVATSRSFLFNC